MKHKAYLKKNSGYTILEVLISISVIVIGISAVMTLVVSNIAVNAKSLDYLVATNLAREGIEMVRNQRDANWYVGAPFDTGIKDPALYAAVIDYNNPNFTFLPDDIDTPACRLLRFNGIYNHDVGDPTDYYRIIRLNDICSDTSAVPVSSGEVVKTNGADCGGLEKIGIDIISHIRWTEKGDEKNLELRGRVYNWR